MLEMTDSQFPIKVPKDACMVSLPTAAGTPLYASKAASRDKRASQFEAGLVRHSRKKCCI